MRRFNVWVNSVNTTSFRIITSVIVTAIGMLGLLIALLFFRWEPTALQLKLLEGEALVALTMMGFDVIQYIGKRFSDKDYATARASVAMPAVNVTAESPAIVQVRPAAASVGAPPVTATVTPSAAPKVSEKGE
jgi:hypothetical protein